MSTDLQWFVFRDDTGEIPEWARSAAVGPDGVVYLPAGVIGSATANLFSASFSGVPLVFSEGHTYVPTGWLAKEYPEHAQALKEIEQKYKEASKQNGVKCE